MEIRDRIKSLRRVKASELKPNPKNWRKHPEGQQNALRGLLAQVGYVGAVLARELEDGTLQIIDGHLRAETTPDTKVPVLVTDLTDAEVDLVLASFDPLGAMAETDKQLLGELLSGLEADNDAVQGMLDDLARENEIDLTAEHEEPSGAGGGEGDQQLDDLEYRVVVSCRDEEHQAELLERFREDGLECRALIS